MAKFIEAVLILSGMIIGAGMFGIPFSFAQAGFWPGVLELAILTGVMLALHLLYGEVALKSARPHQLPGYVREHFGQKRAVLAWASSLLGITLTLLAYVVVGSIFIRNILESFWNVPQDLVIVIFLVILGALVTALPLKKEALINGVLTALLVGFIIFLVLVLLPKFNWGNLGGFSPQRLFLPYGVLLFALSGGVVIPELVLFLGKDRARTRAAIIIGTLLPALFYFLFALAVVGASGSNVSEETIRGLEAVVGKNILLLGSAIGFLAVFTSFTALTTSFQELLSFDLGAPNTPSWLLAIITPFILYLFGFHNFIAIIGSAGALGVGVDSALIIATEHRLRERAGSRLSFFSHAWRIAIYLMIVAGVLYELFKIFRS